VWISITPSHTQSRRLCIHVNNSSWGRNWPPLFLWPVDWFVGDLGPTWGSAEMWSLSYLACKVRAQSSPRLLVFANNYRNRAPAAKGDKIRSLIKVSLFCCGAVEGPFCSKCGPWLLAKVRSNPMSDHSSWQEDCIAADREFQTFVQREDDWICRTLLSERLWPPIRPQWSGGYIAYLRNDLSLQPTGWGPVCEICRRSGALSFTKSFWRECHRRRRIAIAHSSACRIPSRSSRGSRHVHNPCGLVCEDCAARPCRSIVRKSAMT